MNRHDYLEQNICVCYKLYQYIHLSCVVACVHVISKFEVRTVMCVYVCECMEHSRKYAPFGVRHAPGEVCYIIALHVLASQSAYYPYLCGVCACCIS